MATILLYLSILIFSTFFVYISEKGKGPLERYTFLFIAFLIVTIPPAIRYDIGTDYVNYLNIYRNIEYINKIEPAYYFINSILKNLNAHFQWVFVLSAFIFSYGIFRSYPKRNAWILHYSVMTMLWFFSLNITRQAIAIAICLVAIRQFVKMKYSYFFLLTIIASTFHLSALVVTLVGAISLIPIRKSLKEKTLPLTFFYLIIVTYLSLNIIVNYIEQALAILNLTKYLGYFDGKYFVPAEKGSGLGILIRIAICIYFILNTKAIVSLNKNYWLITILIFGYAISTLLANYIVIFERLQVLFVLGNITLPYILLNLNGKFKFAHRIVLTLTLLLATYNYINTALNNDPNAKINPYQTIFSNRINIS